MTLSDSVHQLQQDIIKIKTTQNTSVDSAMLYRLDIDLRSYIPTSNQARLLKIRVSVDTEYDMDRLILTPIGNSNNPPTLVPTNLGIGQNPSNPFEFYYKLYPTHTAYPKFDTYGARMSIYSNFKISLVNISDI